MKLGFYVCLCDGTAVWKQICKQILCLHSLTQFCFLFFEILSRCEPRKIQKQKEKRQKNEPSCSVKVAQGWENENGFPPLTGLQLLGFGVQKADQLRWTCQEGRQEKDCFFFFLFDAAVIISWVCETQRRLKCPLMACLISEWQFCQLGLDWSLCLRAICFQRCFCNQKKVKHSSYEVAELNTVN